MDAVRRGLARVHANLVDSATALTCISHKAPARLLPLHTPAAARYTPTCWPWNKEL